MNKTPSDMDRHIGTRVRERRVAMGLSQEKLGNALGVTFQQIQKYEKGSNRVGAGRLQQAAQVLGVSVSYFYENGPIDLANGHQFREPDELTVASLTADEAALLAAYRRLSDQMIRKRVQQLVEAMAQE